MQKFKGFSLIESLLSLGLTLAVVLAGLEFFGVSRSFLVRLKEGSEDRRAALAAMDKIASDLGRAGRDLAVPIGRGLVSGVTAAEGRLTIEGAERELFPLSDIQPGQTRISVVEAAGVKAGRELVLHDGERAQAFLAAGIEGDDLLVAPEAASLYLKETSRLLLLSRVEYRLDSVGGIIRRKENGGGGQPLIESVSGFAVSFDPERNIVAIRLALRSRKGETYESFVFPKNLARAFRR